MRKPILVLAIIILTGCTVAPATDDAPVDETGGIQGPVYDMTASTMYMEDNTWAYDVTADVPTPCHELKVEAVVAESFPEQVTLNIYSEQEVEAEVCAQVLTTKRISGNFQASEEATVTVQEIS